MNLTDLLSRLDSHYVALKYPTGVQDLAQVAEDCKEAARVIRDLDSQLEGWVGDDIEREP